MSLYKNEMSAAQNKLFFSVTETTTTITTTTTKQVISSDPDSEYEDEERKYVADEREVENRFGAKDRDEVDIVQRVERSVAVASEPKYSDEEEEEEVVEEERREEIVEEIVEEERVMDKAASKTMATPPPSPMVDLRSGHGKHSLSSLSTCLFVLTVLAL